MIYLVAFITVLVHGCYNGGRLIASLFALQLGANPFEVGVLAGLYASLSLVLAISAGKLSDRLGPARPMILGSLLSFVALAIAWQGSTMPLLYVSAALSGAGFIFFNVSVQSMAALMSDSTTRARNFGTLSQAYSVSTLLGPLAAGYGVEYYGAATTFVAFALVAVVPALILLSARGLMALRTAGAKTDAGSTSVLDLLRDRPLRRSFISSGLVVSGWDLYVFYLPVYGHQIGLSPSTIGAILAVFGVSAFMVRYFLAPLVARLTEPGLLAVAVTIAAVVFAIFPMYSSIPFLVLASALLGLTLGLGQPLSMMITYSRAPAVRAGEANGVRLMLNHVTHMTVPIVAGAVGTAFGVGPVFWLNALCLLAAAKVLRRH
jgi:MFS family permease